MIFPCQKGFCYIENIQWQNSRKANKKQTLGIFNLNRLNLISYVVLSGNDPPFQTKAWFKNCAKLFDLQFGMRVWFSFVKLWKESSISNSTGKFPYQNQIPAGQNFLIELLLQFVGGSRSKNFSNIFSRRLQTLFLSIQKGSIYIMLCLKHRFTFIRHLNDFQPVQTC